jgi:hypothetical protein
MLKEVRSQSWVGHPVCLYILALQSIPHLHSLLLGSFGVELNYVLHF